MKSDYKTLYTYIHTYMHTHLSWLCLKYAQKMTGNMHRKWLSLKSDFYGWFLNIFQHFLVLIIININGTWKPQIILLFLQWCNVHNTILEPENSGLNVLLEMWSWQAS